MEKNSIIRIWKNLTLLMTLLMAVLTAIDLSNALPTGTQPLIYVESVQANYRDELITVNVNIANLSKNVKSIGIQFRLRYNVSLLQTQTGWVNEGAFFKSYGDTFFTSYVEDNYVIVGVLLVPNETGIWPGPYPEGSGTLATITFKALYPFYESMTPFSSTLTLYDVILVDADINPIPHIVRDGLVVFSGPTIAVHPRLYVANRKSETFSINIDIKDVSSGWHLIGAEFKLRYNNSLLQVVSVNEGAFFKSFGVTFFTSHVEDNYVLVGVLLLPAETGGWPGPYPEGSGTLATITFKALYQPVELTSMASCNLTLYDTILIRNNLEQIPHSLVHGEYRITAETLRPIEIQIEAGTIHFRGEIVDFHILVTDYGKAVDPETMYATLYFNGTVHADLSAELERVSKGLYRVVYEIPVDAKTGAYLILVEAEYLQVRGTSIESFQISSTLSGWNAYLTEIKDRIATIVIPSLNEIKVNLAAINGTLVNIKDNIATIETSLGTLKTDVANLNITVTKIDGAIATIQTSLGNLQGKIDKIDGDTVTIKTDVGDIKIKVSEIKTDVGDIEVKVSDVPANVQTSINLLYATLILALIAAIGAILAVVYTRKK